MIRPALLVAAALAAVPVVVAAQIPPRFEVSSIKPSADQSQSEAGAIGVHISGSQARITYMSIKDYIMTAYGVRAAQVSGPDWMAQQRFDIAAKLPDGSSATQVNEMLQSLLADRFELKIHHEMREFPVYVLVKKNAFALTPVADAGAASSTTRNVVAGGGANGVVVDLGEGASFQLANNQMVATNVSMVNVANVLTRFVDRPVLDETGLPGAYNFVLNLTPDEYNLTLLRTAVNAGVVLPPQALRGLDTAPGNVLGPSMEKIGLSLDSRRAPLDVIVVDSVRKTPTDD
jgi:uncharacterized protein (TIGR03435 family)